MYLAPLPSEQIKHELADSSGSQASEQQHLTSFIIFTQSKTYFSWYLLCLRGSRLATCMPDVERAALHFYRLLFLKDFFF